MDPSDECSALRFECPRCGHVETDDYEVIDRGNYTISTTALLTKHSKDRAGFSEINLSEHLRQPIVYGKLKNLLETLPEVVKNVLDHYRPIDLSMTVYRKSQE